jgi:hypothetical protein
MVVDGHERAPAGPALGFGKERDLLGSTLAGRLRREEAGPGLQVVEVDAGLRWHGTMIAPAAG